MNSYETQFKLDTVVHCTLLVVGLAWFGLGSTLASPVRLPGAGAAGWSTAGNVPQVDSPRATRAVSADQAPVAGQRVS